MIVEGTCERILGTSYGPGGITRQWFDQDPDAKLDVVSTNGCHRHLPS